MGDKVIGYTAMSRSEELVPRVYDAPVLKADEVRVAVTHCGICGSDLQAVDDTYQVFDFPFVPGHEVVGIIREVGDGVPVSRLGERVGVGWQARACGKCELCRQGLPQLCLEVVDNGTWTPIGGFSSAIVAQSRFVYPLPADMADETAAVLLCAGLSVYSALSRHSAALEPWLGVVGIGGLGHLALQFGKALGYEVTAISSSAAKREEALAFGASRFLDMGEKGAFKPFNDYLNLVLITAHGGFDWDRILGVMKRRGKIILAAFPKVTLDPVDLVVHELSIAGTFVGTPDEMREMLVFAQAHHIRPMVEVMPLSRVNEAVRRVRENKARYRVVLVNDLG